MLRYFAGVVICLGGLVACALPKYVVSDVSRHHSLPVAPSGQTFAIFATNDEQKTSLAFKGYAEIVTDYLSSVGLKPSPLENVSPDLAVTLSYSVEGPSPDFRARSSSFSVGFGYHNNRNHFGSHYGYPNGDMYGNTKQVYTRRVDLDIYDGGSYGSDSPNRVFEGNALSLGTNGQLEPVMPYILRALFIDFPGASGSTKTIRVEIPPEAEAAITGTYSARSGR